MFISTVKFLRSMFLFFIATLIFAPFYVFAVVLYVCLFCFALISTCFSFSWKHGFMIKFMFAYFTGKFSRRI